MDLDVGVDERRDEVGEERGGGYAAGDEAIKVRGSGGGGVEGKEREEVCEV